ncbi:MAG: hypothetical protein WDM81_11725 [Rhizomicrobium sp.]
MPITGDQLLTVLAALANPHALRIVAALKADGATMSASSHARSASAGPCCTCIFRSWKRPASLRASSNSSADGKALNYFEVAAFAVELPGRHRRGGQDAHRIVHQIRVVKGLPMSPTIYLLTLGVFFGTILAVFGMKYFASARQAPVAPSGGGCLSRRRRKGGRGARRKRRRAVRDPGRSRRGQGPHAAVEKILKEVG